MILLSHPTGNNFSRALLAGLLDAGLLARFVTTVAVRDSDWFVRSLPAAIRDELLRRSFDLPASLIETHPLRELCRLTAQKTATRFLTRHETGIFSCDAVYRALDRTVARSLPGAVKRCRLTGVYAYEDGALETFRTARDLGLGRLYDLPIAYWEASCRLMEQELERLPEWKATMEAIQNSESKLARKTAELELADTVICPSKFVYDTLPAAVRQTKRCVIAPFGSPLARPAPPVRTAAATGPLRVLFAGSMSQRKGLADLFAAMKLVGSRNVQLIVFGSPIAPMPFYRSQYPDFIYESPRPNREVLALMETCDILVLPSLVEGRALVQQEALSCGLPLIITPNTGGEDLIEEGRTGFLVPIRSPAAIAEKIDWFASHRAELEDMRQHARNKAAMYTWDRYSKIIVEACQY